MSTNVDLELLLREFDSTGGWDKYDMMRELREFVRNDKRDAEIFAMEQRIEELEAEVRELLEAGKVSEYVSDPPTAPTEGA